MFARARSSSSPASCEREVAKGGRFDCLITGDAELRRLNREFRGKDYATDVLSFPAARRPAILGDLAISAARARAQAREFGHTTEDEIRILMLHGVLHLLGMDHETDGGRMARAEKRWRARARAAQRPDRAGAVMMLAVILATLIIDSAARARHFVQVLYLESLRLRTRDLPSLKFFKETLEDKIGLKTEEGAGAFSLIKHSLLVCSASCSSPGSPTAQPWHAAIFWQAGAGRLADDGHDLLRAAAASLPPHHRRTGCCRWSRCCACSRCSRGPCDALLSFFQSLIDLADDTAAAEEEPTPAENIEALISAGTEEGLIEEEDRKLIQSVVEFGDKVVREVMTPRPNIVAISADATLEQLRQLVINEQYSRIPVYEQNIDQVIGFVHVRDMFEVDEDEREGRTVRELVRPILFVPETKPVSDLMRQMQQENTHMVIVVDEYGNTAGLATMEDLLEVIIGEIRDEHEPDSDVIEDGKGGYIVSGNFDLGRVGDLLDTFHPEEDIESTTVGGLVSEWLGRVPKAGESVERDGIRIEVLGQRRAARRAGPHQQIANGCS